MDISFDCESPLKPCSFLSLSWCLRQRMGSGTMTSSQESASGKWSKSQGLSWSRCMDQGTRAWRTWGTVATSALSCRPSSASQSSRERKWAPLLIGHCAASLSGLVHPVWWGNPLLLPWGFCCILLNPRDSTLVLQMRWEEECLDTEQLHSQPSS